MSEQGMLTLMHGTNFDDGLLGYGAALFEQVGRCMLRLQAIHKQREPVVGARDVASAFKPTPLDATGFCVRHRGRLFVVSAAHVWKSILEPRQPDRMFLRVDAVVGFGAPPYPDGILLFDVQELPICLLGLTHEEPPELRGGCGDKWDDFAMWEVQRGLAVALESAGLRPLEGDQLRPELLHATHFAVLGFPMQLDGATEYGVTESGGFLKRACSLVMLVVNPTSADDYRTASRRQLFTGKIVPTHFLLPDGGQPINGVNGLSGGPILAIDVSADPPRIALVAVQVAEPQNVRYLGEVFGAFTPDLFRLAEAGGNDHT